METETWKHITLGELYRNGFAKARQAHRSFKQYSPLKLDLTSARNLNLSRVKRGAIVFWSYL
jgi:hypothetical protein